MALQLIAEPAPDHVLSTASLTEIIQSAWVIDQPDDFSVSLIWANEHLSAELNQQYRQKNKPTNVLSFPMFEQADLSAGVLMPGMSAMPLGDIVVCLPVLQHEASTQGKTLDHHLTHLLIHAMLHLQGYDHVDDAEAEIMEALEVQLLAKHGICNPY